MGLDTTLRWQLFVLVVLVWQQLSRLWDDKLPITITN